VWRWRAGAQAQFGAPVSLNVAADGSLYVNDPGIKRIRRIAPDGIIATIAGSGNGCSSTTFACGESGPAQRADLGFGANGPQRISLLPDGSFYVAETSTHRVRHVGLPLPASMLRLLQSLRKMATNFTFSIPTGGI